MAASNHLTLIGKPARVYKGNDPMPLAGIINGAVSMKKVHVAVFHQGPDGARVHHTQYDYVRFVWLGDAPPQENEYWCEFA